VAKTSTWNRNAFPFPRCQSGENRGFCRLGEPSTRQLEDTGLLRLVPLGSFGEGLVNVVYRVEPSGENSVFANVEELVSAATGMVRVIPCHRRNEDGDLLRVLTPRAIRRAVAGLARGKKAVKSSGSSAALGMRNSGPDTSGLSGSRAVPSLVAASFSGAFGRIKEAGR